MNKLRGYSNTSILVSFLFTFELMTVLRLTLTLYQTQFVGAAWAKCSRHTHRILYSTCTSYTHRTRLSCPFSDKRTLHQRCLFSKSKDSSLENGIITDRVLGYKNMDRDELEHVYKELKSLAAIIRAHDALYYNEVANTDAIDDSPAPIPISDDEYDILVKKEATICEEFPDLLTRLEVESGLGEIATRFGGRVGPVLLEPEQSISIGGRLLEKVEHLPMLSLENAMNNAHVLHWLERIEKKMSSEGLLSYIDSIGINCTPKLDGLSLTLRYRLLDNVTYMKELDCREYQLEWAATRGNGKIGDDVSEAVIAMNNIPKMISIDSLTEDTNFPSFLEIRGEVVLPVKSFHEYQQRNFTEKEDASNHQIFSNPRNAASGILRRTRNLSNETVALRAALQFYAYDVVSCDDSQPFGETAETVQHQLKRYGFLVPHPTEQVSLTFSDKENINKLFDFYESLVTSRQKLPFEIDGAVYKLDSLNFRSLLGASSRTPRWALAHKFAAQSAVTRILDVETQVGRTGAITPVAILEPVNIGGVSVSRATLHNFSYAKSILGNSENQRSVQRMTPVIVLRAGDVIPQVTRRLELSDLGEINLSEISFISLMPPTRCPACGSSTTYDRKVDEKTNNSGQVLRCTGSQLACKPRAVAWLSHAFSRDAIDISGLSEAKITQLINEGILREPSDLFRVCTDEGWGTKSSMKLASTASKVMDRGVNLSQFIYSLGIRHCGLVTSKVIASAYCSGENFLDNLKAALNDDTNAFNKIDETVNGVGPVLIESLKIFAKDKELLAAAENLSKILPIHSSDKKTEASSSNKPLDGLRVVFSGGLGSMSRSAAKEYALLMGAISTPSNVSKATNLVIAGEGGGKKLDAAKELGIKTVDSTEWFRLVEEYEKTKGSD